MGVEGSEELTELATLACDLDTMDVDMLRGYRDLARSQDTMDADELLALKRLADREGTNDPALLKKPRMKEKRNSASLAPDQDRTYSSPVRSSAEKICVKTNLCMQQAVAAMTTAVNATLSCTRRHALDITKIAPTRV